MRESTSTLVKIGIFSLLLGMSFLAHSKAAHSSDFFVTSVVREIPMKGGEQMFRDYYINAGSNNGLRKGVTVDAMRKVAAYDNINSKVAGDTAVRIARLKLIHVDKNLSVGRLVKFYEKEITPVTGVDGVMIGDLVEVSEKQ